MTAPEEDRWVEANKRYLSSSLALLHKTLERHSRNRDVMPDAVEIDPAIGQNLDDEIRSLSGPFALDILCTAFRLSGFERNILLMCTGMELESEFASICAAAQGNPSRPYPTFSLALAALPDAHWSAITPASPLRHWRLIEVDFSDCLTSSRLRIDECILHYLVGINYIDERLAGMVRPMGAWADLAPSHRSLAERIAGVWSGAAGKFALPVIQLCGNEAGAKRDIAAIACRILGLNLSMVTAKSIPSAATELETFMRLLERKSALHAGALLLDCDEVDAADVAAAGSIQHLVNDIGCPLIFSSRGGRQQTFSRTIVSVDVPRPKLSEQRLIWESNLGSVVSDMNGQVDAVLSQFDLSVSAIQSVCEEVLAQKRQGQDSGKVLTADGGLNVDDLKAVLWDACRLRSRSRMEDLAWRIDPAATWGDLVLPEHQLQLLQDIAVHVRNRPKVYEEWGFARKNSQGMGISALFAGASGTGKTMAAEVLASELCLDLYRIDLSSVVSKYIGETEKNLRRVFDAAEEGGAILLFDEADALFGKRSEVRDSHDRYANIEVSYLLQRMEAYRGLAILTTNMKNALDTAFLRRIRFVVHFPFPDSAERSLIWKRMFPADTPTESLDFSKLSRLNMAGGNIKNIALNAAFLAADAGKPIGMAHIRRAAQAEYAKLERPLTEAETGGWV